MVRARSHKRQPHRQVHPLIHPQVLHRDQPLVVVHGNHHIELGKTPCPHKHRVRRPGTTRIDPQGPSLLHRRTDHADLLVPQQPILARVRVDARHGDPGRLNTRHAQERIRQPDRLHDACRRQTADRHPQRHMDAHQHRAQLLVGQHHPHRHIPPNLRQNLRMPRIHVARQVHCGLAERRRHHRPDLARHRILRRPVHRLEGCLTACRRNLAHRKILGHLCTRHHLQKARIQPQPPRNCLHPPRTAINDKRAFQARFRGSGKGSQNDLRPNARRIPHRDGNRLPNWPLSPFLAQRPIRFLGIHRSSHHQGTSRVVLTASLARRARGPLPGISPI